MRSLSLRDNYLEIGDLSVGVDRDVNIDVWIFTLVAVHNEVFDSLWAFGFPIFGIVEHGSPRMVKLDDLFKRMTRFAR